MGDYRYVEIQRTLYDKLRTSDSTQVVAREDWLPFIERMAAERGQEVRQVWGWPSGLTAAVVEVIREYVEPGGSTAWKRDRWYLVETGSGNSTGSVLMSGPDKDVEGAGPQADRSYGHHGNALPGWPIRNEPGSP